MESTPALIDRAGAIGAMDLIFFIFFCFALYLVNHGRRRLENMRWLLTGPQVLSKKYVSSPFSELSSLN